MTTAKKKPGIQVGGHMPGAPEISKFPMEVRVEAETALKKAGDAASIKVTTQDEYEAASETLAGLRGFRKGLEAKRKEMTAPLDQSKKAITEFFRSPIERLENAERHLSRTLSAYYDEVQRKAREAEAAAIAAREKEEAKLRKQAERAEEKGQLTKAVALQNRADIAAAAPVVAEVAAPSSSATTVATLWSAEVYDKLALIKAVAAGQASMNLLEANMPAINAIARAEKDTLSIPGVRAVSTRSVRARG